MDKEEKPQTKDHLVQSSVQQNSSHECRAKILTPRQEAFPTSLTPKHNIQQEHSKSKLQLHAEHVWCTEGAQQFGLAEEAER